MASTPNALSAPFVRFATLVLFHLAYCASAPATEAAQAGRVVSLGGAVTEIVAALDADAHLVAVDDSSVYPAGLLERLPSVGYYRTLSAESVLATRPDLILAAAGAGPEVALARLSRAGVGVVTVPEIRSLGELVEAIEIVGDALGRAADAEVLARRVENDMATLQARLRAVESEPAAVFVLGLGGGRLMLAGRDTAAHELMQLAGARNLSGASSGYKPASAETLVALAPEVIVTTSRTVAGVGGREALAASPGFEATPAVRAGRIVVLDDLLALGFGPRLPTAIRELAAGLHPSFEGRSL